MKLHPVKFSLFLSANLLFWCCLVNASTALSGPLRINLSNGTSIEVPYYWEEDGEIKFEMPGGVAGIPKAYVTSVQEIVTLREFDPEVMVEYNSANKGTEREKMLADIVEKQAPAPPTFEKIGPEKSVVLLDKLITRNISPPAEQLHGPLFSKQGDFTDLVRLKGNGLLLVMQNILSSQDELNDRQFLLTLYNAEGNVLQRQSCDVYKVEVDAKTMKKLDLHGHLYSVMATIKPNPQIRRYEISVLRR